MHHFQNADFGIVFIFSACLRLFYDLITTFLGLFSALQVLGAQGHAQNIDFLKVVGGFGPLWRLLGGVRGHLDPSCGGFLWPRVDSASPIGYARVSWRCRGSR